MKKIFLAALCICFSLGLCSCGIDHPSVICLEHADDNGLYYSQSHARKRSFQYFDETTGKSRMISREYFPAHQPDTDRAIFADDGSMILFRSDENGDDIYMMKEDDIEYVTKLDLDVIAIADGYDLTCEQFVLKADEDSIYWGIDNIVLGEPESTTQYLGIYRQDLHDHSSSVAFEKCYDKYFKVLGSANNMVYMIVDEKELISINMETGEEKSLCESSLLSGFNLIRLYEDGIIILGEAEIYWSDLDEIDFKNIANLQKYKQSWLGLDRVDNTVYFVVSYEDDNGNLKEGIAALDLESGKVSSYHEFTGWKNRSLHVYDLMIGENGFYYENATHSKIAGGGIYYYDSQKDRYIRIAN